MLQSSFWAAIQINQLIDWLIDWLIDSTLYTFTESYLSDIDNVIPFENTTPVNQNNKVKI